MAAAEHLDALRKQNRELLARLRRQTEGLESLRPAGAVGSGQPGPGGGVQAPRPASGRETDRAALTGRSGGDPVVAVLAAGGKRPQAAREALCKPRGQRRTPGAGETPDEALTPTRRVTDQCQPSEDAPYSTLLQNKGNNRFSEQIISKRSIQSKPIIHKQDRDQRGLDRVSFLSPDLESTSERQRMQPLLGYDWIAGLLDAESSLTERSEQFFSELRSFRQVNKDECVHSQSSSLPTVADPWLSSAEEDATDRERTPDTHQCTFCYRINSRLFAAPLDPQAACSICKMPKAKHPNTEQEPAFIRVSIPRSTLLPAYRYQAHRRSSFDPSDSLCLPAHCLSGWSNPSLNTGSQMSSLDLRSSLVNRPDTGLVAPAQPEDQLDVSGSRAAGSQRSDQLLDTSRLARYRFQHLGPARSKHDKNSYPVY